MEKSPRSLGEIPESQPHELTQVRDLIYRIESEASYSNPQAPARIEAAGKQLLDHANKSLVMYAWMASNARVNAATLLERSLSMMNTNTSNPILAFSSQMLFQNAHQIFSAINKLHQKIETMPQTCPL